MLNLPDRTDHGCDRMPAGLLKLSRQESRCIAVAAQLYGERIGTAITSPLQILEQLGSIQLDAMQRVDKSHRLVCFARSAAIKGREQIDEAFWTSSGDAVAYETWAHAVCLVPVSAWPVWRFRREATRDVAWAPPPRECDRLVGLVREMGPQTIREMEAGQTKTSGWDWSQAKTAAEYLVWTGQLVCRARRGARRVYDIPERCIPAHLLASHIGKDEAMAKLVRAAARAYGVASVGDIATYFSLNKADVAAVMPACGLTPVMVEGWNEAAWLHPDAAADPPALSDAILLSPFDNLIWDRHRLRRLFGFNYVLEAYKPAVKRIYGPYVMPLLEGAEILGRADVARDKHTLHIMRFFPEPGITKWGDSLRSAIFRLAQQMGCESVQINESDERNGESVNDRTC